MTRERIARLIVTVTALVVPLAVLAPRWLVRGERDVVVIRARMPEAGGWTPSELTATVGDPLRLRLVSDDVVHSFAIGRSILPAIELKPGVVVDTTLTFEDPGRYVFYCTRWCGPDHWRMRGTIVVEARGVPAEPPPLTQPLYQRLGLNLDTPHPAPIVPARRPSADRGAALGVTPPDSVRSEAYYRSHSPADAWSILRTTPGARALTDGEVWDLVALTWASRAPRDLVQTGRSLYAANCAACHGEFGKGDGVMARRIARDWSMTSHRADAGPADFTDATAMLGASPAMLQGKILRGGMGTGMPNWGTVLTDRQTWALVAYLWTFQFGRPEPRTSHGSAR